MPRRTAAPIGGSTRQQPLATPQRQPPGEQQGQSRQWDDHATRWDQSTGIWEPRDYQDRSRSSRQWQDDQQWTEQSRYTQGGQDWGSQPWTSRSTYGDTGSQHQWRDQQAPSHQHQDWNQPAQDQQWSQPSQGGWQNPQAGQQPQSMSAAQQWVAQQQQQLQQQPQLPTLPAPVYPPGMQPSNVQAPPGLVPSGAQSTWQGATTQNAPQTFQFGSSGTRRQSPFGSQPQQGLAVDRQQSPFGPQPQQPTGNLQVTSIHFTEGECSDT